MYWLNHFESAQMKFPEILESWQYLDPALIGDGLIVRSERANQRKPKPERKRKDKYYTQSRAIEISSMVRLAKKNGGSRVD